MPVYSNVKHSDALVPSVIRQIEGLTYWDLLVFCCQRKPHRAQRFNSLPTGVWMNFLGLSCDCHVSLWPQVPIYYTLKTPRCRSRQLSRNVFPAPSSWIPFKMRGPLLPSVPRINTNLGQRRGCFPNASVLLQKQLSHQCHFSLYCGSAWL